LNNRKSPAVFIILILIIVFIAVFCFTQLEIVPDTRWVLPAREVRDNQFYALEEWLKSSGRTVRILPTGNMDVLLNTAEKIIFVENSCFKWNSNAEFLLPWLEEGRHLIISLDSYTQYQLEQFMESLGIASNDFYNDDNETESSFIIEEENIEEENIIEEEKDDDESPEEETPDFDFRISFTRTDPETRLKYKTYVINSYGKTKLVKFEIGKGVLIFTGEAKFLTNYGLHEKQNIDLAADIFLVDSPGQSSGILFFRSPGNEHHLIGNLAERGNPAALFISLCLLIAGGFWMAIPAFGRYKPSPEKPGKPLRERFLAEGRFLKKNHALGKYIETYEKELEQRSRSRGINPADGAGSSLKNISFAQFLTEQRKLTKELEKLNRKSSFQNKEIFSKTKVLEKPQERI
jgi:hypothetical protein